MYSESLSRKALILIVVGFLVVAINPFHSHAAGSVSGAANGAVVNANVTVLGVPTALTLTNAAPVSLPSTGGSVSDQIASVTVSVPGVVTVLSTGLIQNTSSGT